jgi:hypothetical protein
MSISTAPNRRIMPVLAAAASLVVTAGCGSARDKWGAQRPETHTVHGRVLVDGKPEADVFVSFESQSHRLTAVGITDASGRFTLKTFRDGDGAVPGEHAVRLEKTAMIGRPGDGPETPLSQVMVLPKKYADTVTSGLTATVVEKGPNEITFEISK